MSCPTCSHTLARISNSEPLYLCERCGTVCDGGPIGGSQWPWRAVYVPHLVARCRDFRARVIDSLGHPDVLDDWEELGIAEAINTPENR